VDFLKNTQAKDIMTRQMICVHPTMPIRQLSEVLIENSITGAPVVDNEQKLLGFVSQADIVELDLYSEDYIESRLEETGGYVQDIMAPIETCVRETDAVTAVIDTMCREKLHRLLVIDEQENLLGIITTMDVICYLQQFLTAEETA
jgi:predicted transcriptional regulator